MQIHSFTPILGSTRLQATREFYVRHFGFEVSLDHEHYLGLRAGPSGCSELGFTTPDKETAGTFPGQGLSFAFQVPDADAEYRRLVAEGAPVVAAPVDYPWGARGFLVRDPNGVQLLLTHPIALQVANQSSMS